MKAIVKKVHQNMKMAEVERPFLGNKEEDNLILKVIGIGICRTDIYVAQGLIPASDNLIIGHELAAYVEECSPTQQKFKNKLVSVNPFFNGKFMGLDQNGAMAEFIKVPVQQVYAYKNPDVSWQAAAYLEPVAAAMAVTKVNFPLHETIGIYGTNRIADLTYKILKQKGYKVEKISMDNKSGNTKKYQYIIETALSQDNFEHLVKLLKHNGTLVIKSRYRKNISFIPSTLLEKEINLNFVNYGDFNEARDWIENNHHLLNDFIGKTYSWEHTQEIFELAQKDENKKLFLQLIPN